ncbi:sulfotransferase family protein [bacterium]|nr:sulfotransferase family protein [bacterium]
MLLHLAEYNRDVVFVHPPRSSGTSIEHSILQRVRSTPSFEVPDSVKHYRASQIKDQISDNRWNAAYKFGIVRNPYDLLASLFVTDEPNYNRYNSKSGNNMSDFLAILKFDLERDNLSIPMKWEHGTTCSDYMDEKLDFIIKYETRNEGIGEVNKVLKQMGLKIDSSQVKRKHQNKNKNYMSYFDPVSKQLVKRLFKEDFDRWYNDHI